MLWKWIGVKRNREIAAFVGGGIAAVLVGLWAVFVHWNKEVPYDVSGISIRDARGLFAWTIGTGRNSGRGFTIGGVEVEVVVDRKGTAQVSNCKGELMFAGGPSFQNERIQGSDTPSFSFAKGNPGQKRYILVFEVPAYRYQPDAARLRIVCDGLISDTISLTLTNMLPPSP